MVIRKIDIKSAASTENWFNQFCLNRPDRHLPDTQLVDQCISSVYHFKLTIVYKNYANEITIAAHIQIT